MFLDQRSAGIRQVTVILNKRSGGFANPDYTSQIRKAFQVDGWHAEFKVCGPSARPGRLAREAIASGGRILIAAGGDGTISAVAASLVGTEAVLGVLPAGTLNHFAKDMKIPLDLSDAIAVIQQGKIANVDIGEVNGHFFVNNSSLGLYPSMVFERNFQRRTGRNKWLAMLSASVTVLHRFRRVRVRLSIDGEISLRKTPFVFVGNNDYQIEGLRAGTRTSLHEGHLSLYIAQSESRLRVIWFAILALCGKLRTAKDFEVFRLEELFIETRRRKLRISLDGEIVTVHTPLQYRVRPGALRVLVP